MAEVVDKNKKIVVGHINIRQSIFFLMLKLIVLDVMAGFLAISYFILTSNDFASGVLKDEMPIYAFAFFLIMAFAKITLGIYIVMKWINEYYEVWPNMITHKSGFLIKHEEKCPLSHIRSIKVEQGYLGKLFGFGTITIYDWFLERYKCLYLIHNPVKYYNIIENLIPKIDEDKQIFQEIKE